jgi:hypothetical protein
MSAADGPSNRNPVLAALLADGAALPETGAGSVRAGATVRLLPVAAEGAAEETGTGRERLTFSFYATAGDLDALRTFDLGADGVPVDASVDWIAPSAPGPVQLWLVVRDGRGGVGWLARTVQVLASVN